LAPMTIAPTVKGMNSMGTYNDSISYKDKITLLDFWYMGCYPCIRSFTALEQLKEKHSALQFQICGINFYDNNAKNISKLPLFLANNKVSYKTILIDEQLKNQFSVSSWPTFYVINGRGEIVFSQMGYIDDLYDVLDEKISVLLK